MPTTISSSALPISTDASSALDAVRQQFQQQIDFFRAKLNLPTQRWDDIKQGAHDRAFIVAGAQKADLLADLRAAVDKSVAGQSIGDFRKQFAAAVAKSGWTGWTGEGTTAGVAWRTRIIYQTNIASSYAAGRWQQLNDPELLAACPYWRYIHSDNVLHPRPQHKAWGDSGLTLRHDHPFWQTHFPPNGWGCHCYVQAVRGPKPGDATTPPEGWDTVLDKTDAPPGIDKGWAYAPGANVNRLFQQLIDDKLIKLDAPIGAAMMKELGPVLLAERSAVYRNWLATLDTDAKAKSVMPIVGAIDPVDLKWLADNNKPLPKSAEIAISSALINGPKGLRHVRDGDALSAQAWENLPELIVEPLAVLYDSNKNTMLYILPEASDKRPQVVLEFDFQRKDQRNMVISAYRPVLDDLLNRIANGSLVLMRGVLE